MLFARSSDIILPIGIVHFLLRTVVNVTSKNPVQGYKMPGADPRELGARGGDTMNKKPFHLRTHMLIHSLTHYE